MKTVYEGVIELERDDGGNALIGELSNDSHMFVRLQSYDSSRKHTDIRLLIGQRVRITVEII